MKNTKIYFYDTEKYEVARLKELLNDAGCQTVFLDSENDKDGSHNKAMGVEEIITLLISSGALVAFITTLQVWIKNKKTKIIIETENKRVEVDTTKLKETEEIIDSLKEILCEDEL